MGSLLRFLAVAWAAQFRDESSADAASVVGLSPGGSMGMGCGIGGTTRMGPRALKGPRGVVDSPTTDGRSTWGTQVVDETKGDDCCMGHSRIRTCVEKDWADLLVQKVGWFIGGFGQSLWPCTCRADGVLDAVRNEGDSDLSVVVRTASPGEWPEAQNRCFCGSPALWKRECRSIGTSTAPRTTRLSAATSAITA